MQNIDRFNALFRTIDEKNVDMFTSYLSSNCVFRFGNLPSISGTEEVREFVSNFFHSIHSLTHNIHEFWSIPEGAICHGTVSYTRLDQSQLTVPFSNIFKLVDDKITEYLIFADTSQL